MALITTPSARTVIGCAIQVHRTLGPGLFESIYQPCLAHELRKAGLRFDQQVLLPVTYDGIKFPRSFRADLVVENELIVEVKALEQIAPVHSTQILTYMRLSGLRKGLLLNFNVAVLKNGIKSYVM
jgi:GxxExxY protein